MIHLRRRHSHGRKKTAGTAVAFTSTLALHAAAVGALLGAPRLERPAPPYYSVRLVAASMPQPQRRRAPEVVQRPAERPAPVETRRPRRTSVSETPPPPTPDPVEKEPAPRTNPAEAVPDAEPSTGSDPVTVKTSGVEFPFPEFLRNVVTQVYRQWNRPTGNVSLRAEVLFFVHRDGSISNFQFVTRSGSFAFDLEAQGAIERAARFFGELPEGYAADVLPVSFFFDPSTIR